MSLFITTIDGAMEDGIAAAAAAAAAAVVTPGGAVLMDERSHTRGHEFVAIEIPQLKTWHIKGS